MNTLIIILGIIVVIMSYYIYTIMTAIPVIIKKMDLTQSVSVISPTTINDPYSINYTVGVWVYVSHFSPQIGRFLMYGDKTYTGSKSLFSLRMDTNGNDLYADILVNKTNPVTMVTPATSSPSSSSPPLSNTTTESITLPVLLNGTRGSFPIQKWVYVAVSVSNNFIETYLNGKFTSAVNINNNTTYGISGIYQATAPSDLNAGATFTFGGLGSLMDNGSSRLNGCPIMLAQLSRWNAPLSSGDVYNNYLKGNGQESGMWGPTYHLNITLNQDKNAYTLPVF
jgi:hypothetical protein